MAKAVRVRTTVLPGNRIQVDTPELPVGRRVEVIVLDDEATNQPQRSVLEFLASLPEIRHSEAEWAEIERQLQEERDARER